ncbi:MAG: tetratricopeptide repeat protein, partial [Planctomycetaceae bacterium]
MLSHDTWFTRGATSRQLAGLCSSVVTLSGKLCQTLLLWGAVVLCAGTVSTPVWADAVDDYNVALTFYKQQRWEQAAKEFQTFLKNFPTHERAAAARLYEGDAFVRLKKFDAAREVFRDFAKVHPEHPDLYISMYRAGECSYFLTEYESARTELTAFLTKFPQHELAEWGLQYLGETELQLKQPARAIDAFNRLISQYPEGRLVDEARYLSARAYLQLGREAEGVALYRQLAAGESPRAADAQLDYAMLLFDKKEFDLAIPEFDVVVKKFPKTKAATLASLNGGYACYQIQKFPEAAARFSSILNDPSRGDEAKFWLGMSHKSMGKYDLAIESHKQLASQSTSPELATKARFYWAHSELLQQHFPEALALFREVAEQKPPGPLAADALHLATEAALLAGELDEANRLHDLFRRDFPQHALLQRQRLLHGRTLLAQGDALLAKGDKVEGQRNVQADAEFAAAEQEFAAVVTDSMIETTTREARLYLARALMRRQADAQVVEALTPIVTAFSGDTVEGLVPYGDALVVQAEALLRLNRPKDATTVASLYLEKLPTGPSVPSALGTLVLASTRLDLPEQTTQWLDRLWKIEPARDIALTVTYQAAEACYARKQWDQAEQHFQRLVDNGPSKLHAPALSGLAYAQYEAGKYPAAAVTFATFVNGYPTDVAVASSAARMKGLALRQAGDDAGADAAYHLAWKDFSLKADVKNPTPAQFEAGWNAYQSAKGWALGKRKQKDLAAAEEAYQAAYGQLVLQPEDKQEPELDRLLLEWALLHYEAEKFERSDELFRQLVKECPKSEYADDAKLYVAESDYFANRLEPAKMAFEELSKLPEADDFVRHRSLVLLLDIAERGGDTDTVIAISKQMAEQFPKSDQVAYSQYRRGEALLKKDDA